MLRFAGVALLVIAVLDLLFTNDLHHNFTPDWIVGGAGLVALIVDRLAPHEDGD
jgi:hypothetical protein